MERRINNKINTHFENHKTLLIDFIKKILIKTPILFIIILMIHNVALSIKLIYKKENV